MIAGPVFDGFAGPMALFSALCRAFPRQRTRLKYFFVQAAPSATHNLDHIEPLEHPQRYTICLLTALNL